LRSSESSHRSDGASTAVTRLPCPQAPLQSMTAAASLTTPVFVPRRGDPCGSLRRQASNRHLRFTRLALRERRKTFRPQGSGGQRSASLARLRGLRRDRQSRPSDDGDRARNRSSETDRLNERRRPKPQRAHQNPPARRWQAIVWYRQGPRWRAHRRLHANVATVVRSTRSALRTAIRR
jgi:hypothetical protein